MPVPHTWGQVGLVRKGEVLGTPNRKTQFGCGLLDPLEPWSNRRLTKRISEMVRVVCHPHYY